MMIYIGNTGHIEKMFFFKTFKILFWSRESKKTIFRIFPDFFRKKRPGTRESRVRRPGNLSGKSFWRISKDGRPAAIITH